MVHISKHQLFCLTVLLQIGSTTLFALGIKAKQDAWIVILTALVSGLLLLWVYTELQKHFPKKNFSEIIINLLGKFLGTPLAIFYGIYYIYLSIQVFTEFGEIIVITILNRTPRIAILILFMLTVFYMLFLGLEVFAHSSEICYPLMLFFILSIFLLISITGLVNLKELRPILTKGITPDIIFEIFHITTFPFGDMIAMLMFWCYVEPQQVIRRTSFLAEILSGLLLCISLIVIISVLGVKFAASASVPLLEVIKLIDIGNTIKNLDAIGTVIIFIGGFYKATIYFYAGVLVFSTIFKTINIRIFIVFLGAFIVIYGNILIKSYSFHRWLGLEVVTKYSHPPFMIIIPCLLLITNWLKVNKNKIST